MTRKQAENILDAYAAMAACDFDDKAISALREVILDAMTSVPSITLPYNPPNIITDTPGMENIRGYWEES